MSELAEGTRATILNEEVARYVRAGYRVESQTMQQAVLVKGHRPGHLLHLLLTLLTVGVWGLLVWLPLAMFGGEKREVIAVDAYGNVRRGKDAYGRIEFSRA